jgi:hypothetical protein
VPPVAADEASNSLRHVAAWSSDSVTPTTRLRLPGEPPRSPAAGRHRSTVGRDPISGDGQGEGDPYEPDCPAAARPAEAGRGILPAPTRGWINGLAAPGGVGRRALGGDGRRRGLPLR